jgi:hypothetical protein
MSQRFRHQPKPDKAVATRVYNTLQRAWACGRHTIADGKCESAGTKRLQRRARSQGEQASVPPIVHDVLRSPGQSLDAETRAFMESRFGHDFSEVRVHVDTRAAKSARAVNADAYTVKDDVVFGVGQYTPHSQSGRQLIAHELTHVVQQRAGVDSAASGSEAADPDERRAENVGRMVTEGRSASQLLHAYQPSFDARAGGVLQRQGAADKGLEQVASNEELEAKSASSDPLVLAAAVGVRGANRPDDVAKVQARLLALGLLSNEDFATEAPLSATERTTPVESTTGVSDSTAVSLTTITMPSDSVRSTALIDSAGANAPTPEITATEGAVDEIAPTVIPESSLTATITAIREFQRALFGKEAVDGNIGPSGPTWRSLSTTDKASFAKLKESWERKQEEIKEQKAREKQERDRKKEQSARELKENAANKRIEAQRENLEAERQRTAAANKLLAVYATYLPFTSTYVSLDESGLARVLAIYAKFDGKLVLKVFDALQDSDTDDVAFEMAYHASDKELASFDHLVLERMKGALTGIVQTSGESEQIIRINSVLGVADMGTKGKTVGEAPVKTLDVFKLSNSVGKAAIVKNKEVPAGNIAKDVRLVQQFFVVAGYMKEDNSEIASVSKIAATTPDAKVPEENLPATIAAIVLWQEKGATIMEFKGTYGRIPKSGREVSHMKILTDVYNKYGAEKPLEEAKLILGTDKWRTQARYGFNYGGKDKALETDYKAEVLKVAGISDPADLSTAPADKIAEIRSNSKFSKGGTVKFYDHADVITYGIREKDKIPAAKPNWLCCFDTAQKMVGYSGATPHGESEKLQTFVEKSHKGGEFTPQASIGFHYIDGQIRNGKAVFIGVDRLESDDNDYNEGVTDHFIAIVGKGKDNAGWYFRYFDPGTTYFAGGTSENNKLHIGPDYQSVGGDKYNVSQIRVNVEEGI